MSERADDPALQGAALLALYDRAVGDVYGYLVRRCGSAAVAEDLTSETFAAAVVAVQQRRVPAMTVAWLIGVARHKLTDHWRRIDRDDRALTVLGGDLRPSVDGWDTHLDAVVAHHVLAQLRPAQRAALTLRYLDGLPVAEVAHHLQRTVGATEVLLVRAKAAFRAGYERSNAAGGDGDAVGNPDKRGDDRGGNDGDNDGERGGEEERAR